MSLDPRIFQLGRLQASLAEANKKVDALCSQMVTRTVALNKVHGEYVAAHSDLLSTQSAILESLAAMQGINSEVRQIANAITTEQLCAPIQA